MRVSGDVTGESVVLLVAAGDSAGLIMSTPESSDVRVTPALVGTLFSAERCALPATLTTFGVLASAGRACDASSALLSEAVNDESTITIT